MSITGKSFLSLRKQDVKEQKSLALGFKKLVFAHKATLGDATINLSSLIIPTEMSSVGFTNPASAEILAAQVYFYRKNLTLISSLKGVLMDYVSYDVTSSSSISFRDFTAEDGEIFIGIIDPVAITGNQIVDAAPLIATGTVAENYTDFNVGQLFEVNKYSTQQVGSVIVYKDGKQQFRNTNNSSTVLDGNYYEVDNGSGSGTIIRFNTAAPYGGYNVLVVSNGLLVYSPDSSALQQIESLAGQIDAMIPTLSDLAGVPETNFQSAPNNVDLKTFGDRVLALEQDIAQKILESPVDSGTYTPTVLASTNVDSTTVSLCRWLRIGNIVSVWGYITIDPTTASETSTSITISLPIATDITSSPTIAGIGVYNIYANARTARITGNSSLDGADFLFAASSASAAATTFNFSYTI